MELPVQSVGMSGLPRGSAGFGLIELMMTILILAILGSIAIPALQGMVARGRLTGQTNELISAMTLARSQAITQNQQVTFCRANAELSTTCSGSPGDWNFWLVRTGTGTVVRRGAVQGGTLTVTSGLTNDQVVFGSDGLARSNNILLLNDDVADISICSDHSDTDNIRQIMLGTGSRLSTAAASGACP